MEERKLQEKPFPPSQRTGIRVAHQQKPFQQYLPSMNGKRVMRKHAREPSSFSRAKHATNHPYSLPLSQSRQQVVSIRVPYQSRAGRTKQAVDLLAPIQFPCQDSMDEAE